MTNDYIQAFITTSQLTPDEQLLEWKEFIEDIKYGYNDTVIELRNDLDIERGSLQDLIDNTLLANNPSHNIFIEEVNKLDEILKDLVYIDETSDSSTWWGKIILKDAREIYYASALEFHKGYKINLIK